MTATSEKARRKAAWLLAALLAAPLASPQALLTGIRAALDPDADRGTIEFRFDNTVFGDEKLLGGARQTLQLNVLGVRPAGELSIPEFPSHSRTPDNRGWPIEQLRVTSPKSNSLRVELVLQPGAQPSYQWLERDGEAVFQVQMNLVDLPPVPLRPVVIAIDAGHGGRDPGAVGKGGGPLEKDITLAVSRRIAQLLNDSYGFRAYLVRDRDERVRLSERRQRASSNNADFYASIHADAVDSPQPYGASVYTLSAQGASSFAARQLAARENNEDISLGGMPLAEVPDSVAQWVTDAIKGNNLERNRESAQMILDRLRRVTDIHGRGLAQADFVVLRGLEMPAVLVELGFVSNRREALALQGKGKGRDRDKPEKLARAIAEGIKDYFNIYALPDTLLAASRSGAGAEHRVQRGDTLSGIARKYAASVDGIRAANGLKGDTIRIGQVLRIPGARAGAQNPYTEYKVVRGDTISEIAARFATSADSIRRINALKSDVIRLGQVLRVPLQRTGSSYRVQSGDTLGEIAARFSVSLAALKSANGLKGDTIRPRQVLQIPAGSE